MGLCGGCAGVVQGFWEPGTRFADFGTPELAQPKPKPVGIIWPMAPGCPDGFQIIPKSITKSYQSYPKLTPK